MLTDLDLSGFWRTSSDAESYVDLPLSLSRVARVEQLLGFRLPAGYLAIARAQNGGIPARPNHRTAAATSWAGDHVALHGIFAIGTNTPYSLCGENGNQFWLTEWGYPALGVYFADCPSAGHDLLCLDYRVCGPTGEPSVVHVDQERDYTITLVAPDFESFVRGLKSDRDIGTP